MKYRRFGKLDWEASILGFGVMALPSIGGDRAFIDEAESIRMIRYAVDQGLNYIDSGYPHDMSQYESRICLLSRALQGGYRDKVKISATLPLLLIHSRSDFDRCLDNQIQWLQTNGIDFYLLGWLNRDNWPGLRELGVLLWAEQAMMDGRIDKLGFSFHDDFQGLRTILEDYDSWSLCQFQYSYMDVDHHPGVGGLKYAAGKGLAVVITEPFRGGRLTKEPPEPVAKAWARAPQERSLAEWGLRWVWDHPEVSTVVSDMSNVEQVIENIALANSAAPDSLTVQEEVVINQVREVYRRLRPIPCSTCSCCMPCPIDIDVPRIFELYNDAIIYRDIKTGRFLYGIEQHCADTCTECSACEDACPKKIAIMDYLMVAHQLLTGCDEQHRAVS